jgi:heptosyltransferase-1
LQWRLTVTIDPASRSLHTTPSILIILMGSLGDIARALPVASLLEQHRPGARISWLVDWRWRELLADHPAIDRLITFPRERTPRAFSRLIGELRAERLDLTLDLQRHLKSGLCSLVSAAPRRIGFHAADAREGNAFFNTEHIPRRPPNLSKLRHYLVFAEHLGLPVSQSLDFGLTRLADPRLLPEPVCGRGAGFVAVVMGSSWRSKDWTPDGYRGLVSLIERETPLDVVLLGDGSQRDLAERVSPAGADSRVVNLVGRTTLAELCATLAAARAAVGPDSGPGHLAGALGTPAVTLIGPTRVERVAPYGCEHLAVRSPVDCAPCVRRTCRRRAGRCMDAITPAMVWQTLAPVVRQESA